MTLFDVSTATLTNQLDLTQDLPIPDNIDGPPYLPLGVTWKPDGTKLYTINISGTTSQFVQWDVPIPWDLSSAVKEKREFMAVSTLPLTLRMKEDGTSIFVLGGWIEVVRYDLPTPFDITGAFIANSVWLGNDDENRDFDFNSDGTELYVNGSGNSTDGSDDRIYKLIMTTPWDLSTASYVSGPNPSRHITENIATGFSFNNDGTRMYVHGTLSQEGIYQYNLVPPYNYKSGSNPNISVNTGSIENQTALFPESLHTLRFGGSPNGSKLYFTSGWYLFGGSPNTLYEMSMPFSKVTRQKPFGSVGVLIKALGANGNCGGFNPLASQGVVDNFVTIPTGTLSGQRLSIDQDPVRVKQLRFVARRGGVGSAGTVKGVIYKSSVPGEVITDENIVEESINEIPCADITTDLAGGTLSFDFDGNEEVTEKDDVFVGLDFQNCDDVIELGTESTGSVIPGGIYTTEEDCQVIRLRSNRNGGNINHQSENNWHIFPLSSAHSNPIPVGEVITHIRVTRGTTNAGVNSRFKLAIYSGPGNGFSNACAGCATPLDNQLRAETPQVSFAGMGVPIGGTVDIPLLTPYILDSSDHNDIQVCRGVFNDGINPQDAPIDFQSNSQNTLRKRISFSTHPYLDGFPDNFLDNASDLDNECFNFLLAGPTVNPDVGVKCFVEEDIVDLSFNVTIDEEVRQRGCFSIGANLLGQTVTRMTDPDEFHVGASFKFTTGVPAFPSTILKAFGENGNCTNNIFGWKSNRSGSDIFNDMQTSHYELFPLHAGSSTPLDLGEKITHIRFTTGNLFGNTQTFYAAIYEGVGENAVIKAHTGASNFPDGIQVPFNAALTTPYFVGTTTHEDIHVCIVVVGPGGFQFAMNMRSDSTNSTRLRLTKGFGGAGFANAFPPDFPTNFTNSPDGQPSEAPLFELVSLQQQQGCALVGAVLKATIGEGGVVNEPKIGALISDDGIKFTCINAYRKRLGENGTEGAGLKSSSVSAFIGMGIQEKETFIGAKLKFPLIKETFVGAKLVSENTKIDTFTDSAIISTNFDTNGGDGITKPFLIGAIISLPFKQFSIDSNISIPAGMTPFTNFSISAVINGLIIEFDVDACVADPFQTLESESVL